MVCCVSIKIISFFLIFVSIMIGSIGTAFYVSDKHGELVYKPTMCFVKSYATIIETCSQQNCNRELGTSVCTTDYYPCSKSMYTVAYNVSDGREVISTIISTDGPGADSVSPMIDNDCGHLFH